MHVRGWHWRLWSAVLVQWCLTERFLSDYPFSIYKYRVLYLHCGIDISALEVRRFNFTEEIKYPFTVVGQC